MQWLEPSGWYVLFSIEVIFLAGLLGWDCWRQPRANRCPACRGRRVDGRRGWHCPRCEATSRIVEGGKCTRAN
jgi:hypothetical protein